MRCLLFFFIFFVFTSLARSPFREQEERCPFIQTQWVGDSQKWSSRSSYYHEGPLFHLYDEKYLDAHRLPNEPLHFRYAPKHSVSPAILNAQIEHFLQEIKSKKKKFTHFKVIKKRDFDFSTKTGFLVLKFRSYPFVLKLFITTPEQFLRPYDYGFESCCFFIMGGGVNRYLSGFTRLKNLDRLKEWVALDPVWRNRIDFPRKWYWTPHDNRQFTLTATHLTKEGTKKVTLPAIYALICDEINIGHVFSLASKEDRATALSLSNFLEQQIDPHINNYVIDAVTGKIILLDTEHFPTMVGLEQPSACSDYLSWYLDLSYKMIKDSFCRTKKMRRAHQEKRLQCMNFFAPHHS